MVINLLLSEGMPVTRKNYIEWAYPYCQPGEWTVELESMLPEHLQNWKRGW